MPSLQAPKTVPRKKRKGAPTSGSETAPSPASTAPTVEELLSGDEEEEEEEEENSVEAILASHFDEPEGGTSKKSSVKIPDKWTDDDDMKMVDLHLKVEEACKKPGRGGKSDAFKAALVAKLAAGPPPTIINGKAPDQAAAKNWRDRKLKAYKTAKEVMTSSGGARVAGKEIPEALYRKLEALFRPIEKAIVPKAGSVAQSGGGMTEEERAAFIAARNAASSSFSSSSSLSSSSSASSSSCASSAPKKMTIKEANRMPLSLDGAPFALGSDDEEGHLAAAVAAPCTRDEENDILLDDDGVDLDVAPSTFPEPDAQAEKDADLIRGLSVSRASSISGNAAQRRTSYVVGDVQAGFNEVKNGIMEKLNPKPTLSKVEMLEEAKALQELHDSGYYTDAELAAEKAALKKKYGSAAAHAPKKGKGKAAKAGN